jgi:thiol-disulfide isomerase/thioredoxin
MDRIKTGAEWLMNNKKVIGYAFIALFFIVLAQQLYNRYIKSSNNASYYEGYSNAPESGASEPPVATIQMFKVDWCPHCKKATPEFENVQQKYDGKIINGHKLNFEIVDGEDPKNESLVNNYNIKGYPTVILTKSDDEKPVELDGKVDEPTLVKFMNAMI